MDHFAYGADGLAAEDVALRRIADAVGTPFYCYSTATMTHHFRVFTEALSGLDALTCYAVKANSNIAVIRTLADLGAGADVVSAGELERSLAAGVAPDRIVYSGVGKTADELAGALDAGILQINAESEAELALIEEIAGARGAPASVALRINPDIDAHSHDKISTGRREDKFGIEWTRIHEVYNRWSNRKAISLGGLALHIGSQVTDLGPFRDAFARLRDLVVTLRAEGHAVDRLDLGGGLGIPYDRGMTPSPAEYAGVVRDGVGDLGCRLLFEPGRVIMGNAGVLVTRVVYVKEGATRRFAIVDAAMNDLMRPALYGAIHEIVPVVRPPADAAMESLDVVGPVCETGDSFAVDLPMVPLHRGDLLALRTAGAYGAVMSSTYNSRPLVAEVLVSGDAFAVIRERVGTQKFLAFEALPDWLAS